MCSCDSTGPFLEIVSIMIVAMSSPCLVVPVFDVAVSIIAVAAATTAVAVAVAVAIAAPATVGVTARMGTTITRR